MKKGEKAKSVVETKSVRSPVDGMEGTVKISLFIPDHLPEGYTFTIPNIVGNSTYYERDPERIAGLILSALRGKFGDKVK